MGCLLTRGIINRSTCQIIAELNSFTFVYIHILQCLNLIVFFSLITRLQALLDVIRATGQDCIKNSQLVLGNGET